MIMISDRKHETKENIVQTIIVNKFNLAGYNYNFQKCLQLQGNDYINTIVIFFHGKVEYASILLLPCANMLRT